MMKECSLSVFWELSPFYRRWHWRYPLWSIWPVRWCVRIDTAGMSTTDYFCTQAEAWSWVLEQVQRGHITLEAA